MLDRDAKQTHRAHRVKHPVGQDIEEKDAANIDANQKSDKVAVVVESNAVVHPRAIVIHPQNTSA